MASPPRKKTKTKTKVKYNPSWREEPLCSEWLREDKLDQYRAYCILCRCSVLCAWGGFRDVKNHMDTAKHKKAVKAQTMSTPIQEKLHSIKVS